MLSKRRLGPWVLFGLLILLGWVTLRVVAVFLDYVLLGLFLAYITYPLYRRLKRTVRSGVASSLLMVFLVFTVIVVPLAFMTLQLFAEVKAIEEDLGLRDPQAFVNQTGEVLVGTLGMEAGAGGEMVERAFDSIRDFLHKQAQEIPGRAVVGLVGTFVLFYVLYYAYLEGPRLVAFVRDLLPMDDGHRDMLLFEVVQVTRGVIVGTVLTALIQAALGGIGFALFGVPNVLFWSLLMFILALLPVIGPPVIWAPWGAYLLLTGETFDGIALLLWGAILVSTADNIIRPKLIGRSAKVHPVVVLLGVLGGVPVFGLSGFILGPLVLSIFVTILQVYRKEFAYRMEEMEARDVWLH